jgi:hypothetical protein
MFVLLSRVLLWLLIGTIVYSLFQRFYPGSNFVGRAFVVILLLVLALAFINPNEPAVSSLWRVISFPLKPLGAAILMLIFAAQRMKDGGLGKPGGYLVGWALGILLLASTPAFAYFMIRSPIAMVGHTDLVSQQIIQQNIQQNIQLASSTTLSAPKLGTLVAFGSENPSTAISDVVGDRILSGNDIAQATLAFNPQPIIPPYLLQNPQEITRRGLRLEDFVPSAETLSLTTNVWESYLNQISIFLRPRR